MNDNSDYYSSADEATNAPAPRAKAARKPSAPRPPRPKVFSCTHCQRCFDRPSLLAQHILIHTGERPHQCPKCNDKRFSRTSNLYRHMRTCKGTGTGPISGNQPTGSKRKANDEQSSTGGPSYPSKHHSLRTTEEDADGDEDFDSIASSPVLSASSSVRSHPPSPLFAVKDGVDPVDIDREPDHRRNGVRTHRGLTPDPSWGPNPLASWKPQLESQRQAALSAHGMPSHQRRYTLPLPSAANAVQMPVSQRVAVGSSGGGGVPRIFGLDSFVQQANANNELRLDGLESSTSPFSSDASPGNAGAGTNGTFADAKSALSAAAAVPAPFQLFPLRTTNNRQFSDLLSPQSANTASSFPNSTPTSATRPQTDSSLPRSGPSSSRNSVSSPSVAGSGGGFSSSSGRGGSGLGDQMEVDETTRNDHRRSSIGLGEATRMAAVADFVRIVNDRSASASRHPSGKQANVLSVQDHLRMDPNASSSSPTRITTSSAAEDVFPTSTNNSTSSYPTAPSLQQQPPMSVPSLSLKTLSTPSFSSFPSQQSKRMPTSIQTDDGMGYDVVMQYLIAEQQQQRSNYATAQQQQQQQQAAGAFGGSTTGMNQFGLASMDQASQGAIAGLGPAMSVGGGGVEGDNMPTREESENMWRDFLEYNN